MDDYQLRLKQIIKDDPDMLLAMEAVEQLNLNDAWICAGFIRNKVWDRLHHLKTSLNDIDVIYFNEINKSTEKDQTLEKMLGELMPGQPWSVKNQARMHVVSGFPPFQSSKDGVSHFPETATAIAIRKVKQEIDIMAPYGLADLFEMKVKPTPYFQDNKRHKIYIDRIKRKQWQKKWYKLKIEY